ncbi:choice-of-anchor A domain-containing protein [Microbacterium terrae]|uniref:Gram-positive cocci surface proteins LPxTG domain-containing protein n=1 Tax=Microbacterium terrae TaxID=69369 RepID=A0A0M2H951_9MICO|nr:DUF5979 domain-containing protein [Microbacterium terrae]KJL40530.1 hypothetical protein RS81_01614 [Microbacterium terrae]MBP1079145.1 choice-of-anchor A domain-containing protein [Microbacterium terrae]GLJ98546.1 hypothetical protein GCM10017594_17430 [Microbacterium terrae]
MHARRRTPMRTWLAALTAAALAVSGAVVVDVASAPPARAAYPDSFNPFSMNGGFTVYAREDALLQNQETEGSIAVGGTSTVQGSSGQYTIIHVSAGTGDYDLPTVDGDPTRYLVGSHSADSTGILAVTSAGTSNTALWGDVKMVERDGPWQAFARADWIRLNENPSNVDQTPLIDATHQTYPASATPPSGSDGQNSVYTANTGATAVADYVEANAEASYDDASDCLDGLSDVGYPVGVAQDAGSRVVLEPLSADRPNIVDYADIAGTALIQYSPGPTPGVANPLIIRVPAGTTEVIGARSDPQGAYSPYIFWDLSALTGDVTVTAAEGRMDGSVYAPEAAVTINAAPLDGQVLGRDVTLLGGEVHSFLFAGEITCDADSGTFEVRKEIEGIDPADIPEGTTFTVNYTATLPDGAEVTGSLELLADGTPVPAGEDFPIGTIVVFEEVEPASVPGYTWTDLTISPGSVEIGAGTNPVITVTNTAEAQPTGTFSVAKVVEGFDGEIVGTVDVDWLARFEGATVGQGVLQVPLDGAPVPVGVDLPVGSIVFVDEVLSSLPAVPGYEWGDVTWSPGSVFEITEAGTTVAATVTNTLQPVAPRSTASIVKVGDDPDMAGYGFSVTYSLLPGDAPPTTIPLPIGDPVEIELDPAAETMVITENPPTLDGQPVDVSGWDDPIFRVRVGTVVQDYSAPFGESVELPIAGEGRVSIVVRNSLKHGSFTIAKEFEQITGEQIPPGVGFAVQWTATTPGGDEWTGVIRVPADGTPTGPVDADGEPLTFPYGTVITYEELTAPGVRGVVWDTQTFAPDSLVIGDGDQAVVTATLTNGASRQSGTFLVTKDVVGIDPDELLTDTFTIDYTAHDPLGGTSTGSFALPADGTPAGPTDDGAPTQFPVGTVITLAEVAPADDALPPGYAWGAATWSPSDSLVIRSGEVAQVEVTNSVEEYTQWAGTKVVDGDGASALPAGTAFPVDWWWDYEPQPQIAVEPNVTLYSPWFPVGSIIELREAGLPDIVGVDWGTPVWTVDGEVLPTESDGRVVLPADAVRNQGVATLTLTNYADAQELPATGGGGMSPILPLGALAAILTGAALLVVRRTARA